MVWRKFLKYLKLATDIVLKIKVQPKMAFLRTKDVSLKKSWWFVKLWFYLLPEYIRLPICGSNFWIFSKGILK